MCVTLKNAQNKLLLLHSSKKSLQLKEFVLFYDNIVFSEKNQLKFQSRYSNKLKFYIFSNRFEINLKIYQYFIKLNRLDFNKKSIRRKLKKLLKKIQGSLIINLT